MSDRLTDSFPLTVGEKHTSFGEMREMAWRVIDMDRDGVRRGLAYGVVVLLDEIERREQEARHESG